MVIKQTKQQTIVDIAQIACKDFADLPAFTCLGRTLSYANFEQLSDYFAAWLLQQDFLASGDRVAIQLPNILQYPVTALGVLKAGLVIVNVNPLYSALELEKQLNDSGAKVLVVSANTAESAAKIISNTNVQQVIVTELADLHGFFKRNVINLSVKFIKKLVPEYYFENQIRFRSVLSYGRQVNSRVETPCVDNEALAVLQYTGGTTGISKGAMLSHRNLVSNMVQLKEMLGDECPGRGDTMAVPLPLYHIYAFVINMVFAMHRGQHSILIPDPRNIPSMVKALLPFTLKGIIGINTLYKALCNNTEFSQLDFSHLKISCSGGMSLTNEISDNWFQLTGCRILEGYGLTEASPLVACGCKRNYKKGVVGKVLPNTQVKIIAKDGQSLEAGKVGEIVLKGPQVMLGYWQQEAETKKVLSTDGWLRTGDLGFFDEEGYLSIVDRLKDLIIVSGFNVYPNEVEELVCTHPDIDEAAVIGVTAGNGEEKVKLFIVSNNPKLSTDVIIQHCRAGLAGYKVPKLVEFRTSLPKSNVGKVLRRELHK